MARACALALLLALGWVAAPSGAQAWPVLSLTQTGTLEDARLLLRQGLPVEALVLIENSLEWWGAREHRDGRYVAGRIRADRAADAEDLRAAAGLLESVGDLGLAEERRQLWLARAWAGLGEHGRVIDAVGAALEADPEMAEAAELAVLRAEALHALGEEGADDEIRRLKTKDVGDELAARALRLKAAHLRARAPAGEEGDADRGEAAALERRLLVKFPKSEAALAPGLGVEVEALSNRQRYDRALALMEAFAYQEARAELTRLLEVRSFKTRAHWHLGIIGLYKLRDDAEGARGHFEQAMKVRKKAREEALYHVMRAWMKDERYDEALKVADQIDEEFPKGAYAETLDWYRAWLPFDHRDCKATYKAVKAYLDKGWDEHKTRVRELRGWCYLRDGNFKRAAQSFRFLAGSGYPLIAQKARYWAAFSLDKIGQREDAIAQLDKLQAEDPLSWYAMLGRQLRAGWEGRSTQASAQAWPEGGAADGASDASEVGAEAWDWPDLKGSPAEGFARVRRLVELGELDTARRVYEGVRGWVEMGVEGERRRPFVRFMSHQVEDYRRAYLNVRGEGLDGVPDPGDVRWRMYYPQAYQALVERLSDEYDLPPAFVYALMRVESHYTPAAVSHADAIGALQMITPTARRVAEEMGLEFEQRRLSEPRYGFALSVFYLRKHADLWHGQLAPTAASYNAGPAPVARWLKKNEGASLAQLVEEFEYAEARNYTRMVAGHTLRYLYMYEQDAQVRGRWLDALFPSAVNYGVPEDTGY